MSNPRAETVLRPFSSFNFAIEIAIPDLTPSVCSAAFAECTGLELNRQVQTIREGGDNARDIHLIGGVSYGQATLKRGMTSNFDLWRWWSRLLLPEHMGLRPDAEVIVHAANGAEQVRFLLGRCLPVKLTAPSLSSTEGLVAIEECVLAYETLELREPRAP